MVPAASGGDVTGLVDVVLLGTGLAPLVAASRLLEEGHSVLVLNPDWDFFLEGSELPFDPLFAPTAERLHRSLPDAMLEQLRPVFPGAVEYWAAGQESSGFRDSTAPHIRARTRLWVTSREIGGLEDFYVEASDGGFNPQLLEGIQATQRFPGASPGADRLKGVALPRLCDVDVTRYRNGLLEFVRERAGPERVICDAAPVELMPGGVRFRSQGTQCTARIGGSMLVFWTPRLTQWIQAQARRFEMRPPEVRGVRHWEHWSLVSREPVDPAVIGTFRDPGLELAVWADIEGAPGAENPVHQLSMLRAGGLKSDGMDWASNESFQSISTLFHGYLKWERVTVRSMTPRAILEWDDGAKPWFLSESDPRVRVIPGCDGPLADVVRSARAASQEAVSEAAGEAVGPR